MEDFVVKLSLVGFDDEDERFLCILNHLLELLDFYQNNLDSGIEKVGKWMTVDVSIKNLRFKIV